MKCLFKLTKYEQLTISKFSKFSHFYVWHFEVNDLHFSLSVPVYVPTLAYQSSIANASGEVFICDFTATCLCYSCWHSILTEQNGIILQTFLQYLY